MIGDFHACNKNDLFKVVTKTISITVPSVI